MSENENIYQDSGEIKIDEKTTLLPPEPSDNIPPVTNENLPAKKGRKPITLTPEEQVLIDEAVQKINDIKYNTIYNAYSEIGNYILDTFFEGKPELATSKDPTKAASFNKLRMRKDLAFSASTLSRMLRVACFEKKLEEASIGHKNIPFTHKAILIRIDDPKERIEKFKEISQLQVSTRELEISLKKDIKKPKIPVQDDIHTVMKRIKSTITSLDNIDLTLIEQWIKKPTVAKDIDTKLYGFVDDIIINLNRFTKLCTEIRSCEEKTSKMKRTKSQKDQA